jgi:short-subunit dehydrogenase
MAYPWKSVWITGASTGIGRELALLLARNGVRVAATARNADTLAELAKLSPQIVAIPADVTSAAELKAAYQRIAAQIGPIDLAILNAGIWESMGGANYTAERAIHSMAVNYGGIATCLEPLIAEMRTRRQGHVALVASVAGYRGLPNAAAYGPSKAAVICLAEVLQTQLPKDGIFVSLINPGFVDTPMTSVNKFPMPFMIGAEDAARRIVRGLETRKFEIAFPWQLVGTLKLLRILPYPLYFRLVRRMAGA